MRLLENRFALGCADNLVEQQAAFEASPELQVLRALEAGRDVGAQVASQFSAALLVYHTKSYVWVDLRADEHNELIAEMRRLYQAYVPLMPYHDRRPSPEHAAGRRLAEGNRGEGRAGWATCGSLLSLHPRLRNEL